MSENYVGGLKNCLGREMEMKIIVDMEKTYGDFSIVKYKVMLDREVNEVRVIFKNEESGMIHKGGEIRLPIAEANRLGHALLMASSGNGEGLTRIQFFASEEVDFTR